MVLGSWSRARVRSSSAPPARTRTRAATLDAPSFLCVYGMSSSKAEGVLKKLEKNHNGYGDSGREYRDGVSSERGVEEAS